ncbi:tyrosine-type recombinase/integrase [Dehalococcoidia bacterium]|nr:tyrosine-type recombinase/integrase [Dehalococcoidia bacterium]
MKEMMEMLLGSDGKRKLRLRHKLNSELFELYDAQLILKHRSRPALDEARRVLRHFQDYLGQFPPSPELAAGFLSQFADRKPATLYRYHAIVNGFMAWYGERLTSKIRVPQTLPNYIESEDIDKLKSALRANQTHKGVVERNILLIELAIKTGLRRSELSNLKVGDINLDRRYLVVRQGKGQKDRIIDLAPSLVELLIPFLKGKDQQESLFGLKPSTISGLVKRAAKKAGVDLHTHSLRDHFGTSLVDTGTDMETVRRLLGHTSLKATQRYIARTDTQRREAVLRLDRADVNDESFCLDKEGNLHLAEGVVIPAGRPAAKAARRLLNT